ncbi:MAG: hypothetical protein AAF629_28950 [Chloroflexota bacterium]
MIYEVQTALLLLGLLLLGLSQALLLPQPLSIIGGSTTVAVWVLVHQKQTLWSELLITDILLNLPLLSISLLSAMYIRYTWQNHRQGLLELTDLKDMLHEGEGGTGLVTHSVAELRLQEEMERSKASQRPVGLLLLSIDEINTVDVPNSELNLARQAIARSLVNQTRIYDLSFRTSQSQIGVILPEREWNILCDDVWVLCQAARRATYIDRTEQARSVSDIVQLRIGWAVNQVENGQAVAENPADLMTMAESIIAVNYTSANTAQFEATAFSTNRLSTPTAI